MDKLILWIKHIIKERIFIPAVAFIFTIAISRNWPGVLVGLAIAVIIWISEKKEPTVSELIESGKLRLRDDSERKEILRNFVARKVANGYRVELQDDFSAVLAIGNRPNHILHLLLSIVTLGIWILVWIFVSINSGEKRTLFTIDKYGVITS